MNIFLMLFKWLVALQVMCNFCLRSSQAAAADSDSECNRKIVSCIQCSTESQDQGSSLCKDPFDSRVKKEFKRLHDSNPIEKIGINKYNISTVMCEGFCIKWVKIPMSGEGLQIVRTCSTSMDIRFSQNTPVCIVESRTGKGTMCFCRENMCNAATMSRAALSSLVLLTVAICAVARLIM